MMNCAIYDPFVHKFLILHFYRYALCAFAVHLRPEQFHSCIISINQNLLQQKNILKSTFAMCKNNNFRRKIRGQVQKQFASFFEKL